LYPPADESPVKAFLEPMVVVAILICNATVMGVWQSQSASDSLDSLQQLQPTLCTPLRDGEWKANLAASELVPGDGLQLRVGDKVPADAHVLELQSSTTLQLDETSLTGESLTVSKLLGKAGLSPPNSPLQSQRGMVFSGTMVTSGNTLAVVVQMGMDNTQFGKIQQGVSQAASDATKTPLQLELDEFGNTLTVVIGGICLLVWIVSIPKMNDASFANVWERAMYYAKAKVALALGVAAIPEGLPAVITLCLNPGTRPKLRSWWQYPPLSPSLIVNTITKMEVTAKCSKQCNQARYQQQALGTTRTLLQFR
jgi:Ca2+-transporting ATPase